VGKAIVTAVPKLWHGAKGILKGVGKAAERVAAYAPGIADLVGGEFGQTISDIGQAAGMVGMVTGSAQRTMNAGENFVRGIVVDGRVDSAAMQNVVSGVKDTKEYLDALSSKTAESSSIKRSAAVAMDAPPSYTMQGQSYVEKPGDESTYSRYKRVKSMAPAGSGGMTYNDTLSENTSYASQL
jgi:hypothetical protein